MPKIVKTEVISGSLVTHWDDDTQTSMPLSGPRLLREGDVVSGGGGVSLRKAPQYIYAGFNDLVLAPGNFGGLSYNEIQGNPGSDTLPWDYSGTGEDWMSSGGNPSEEIDFGDGFAVDTQGSFKITEAGLYFIDASWFITQGGGNTGDDQVGEFVAQLVFEHGASFMNLQYQVSQSVKETNADSAVIVTGVVPIWDIMLQPEVNVSSYVKHTSTGTLTVGGQLTAFRVS